MPRRGKVKGWFKRSGKFIQDFLMGATRLELEQSVQQEKLARSDLMILILFGDLLGVPVFPSYYAWRLFPLFSPRIDNWKKRMMRKRDLTEMKDL